MMMMMHTFSIFIPIILSLTNFLCDATIENASYPLYSIYSLPIKDHSCSIKIIVDLGI